jgi:hypothetical protein
MSDRSFLEPWFFNPYLPWFVRAVPQAAFEALEKASVSGGGSAG